MSKDTPAHIGKGDAHGPGTGANGAARTASPVAQALRDLAPPRHGRTFWSDLDARLADEPQLRLAPRSAIRPITQPPPGHRRPQPGRQPEGATADRPRAARRAAPSWRWPWPCWCSSSALRPCRTRTTTSTTTDTSETTDGRTPTSDEADRARAETAPPVTPPPGAVDPAPPLDPGRGGPPRDRGADGRPAGRRRGHPGRPGRRSGARAARATTPRCRGRSTWCCGSGPPTASAGRKTRPRAC